MAWTEVGAVRRAGSVGGVYFGGSGAVADELGGGIQKKRPIQERNLIF